MSNRLSRLKERPSWQSCLEGNIEIVRHGNRVVIHDRVSNAYFKTTFSAIGEKRHIAWVDNSSRLSPVWLGAYIVLFLTMLIKGLLWLLGYLASSGTQERGVGGGNLALVVTIVGVNLFIHEIGHILALRWCGRRPDKIGFKLNYWIMPTVFVRMNQVSLLPKGERLLCHSAGLFANLVAVNLLILFQALLGAAEGSQHGTALVTIFIACNLLPLWNADGQRMLLGCFDLEEVEGWSGVPKVLLILRVFSLGALIYAIAAVLASLLKG